MSKVSEQERNAMETPLVIMYHTLELFRILVSLTRRCCNPTRRIWISRCHSGPYERAQDRDRDTSIHTSRHQRTSTHEWVQVGSCHWRVSDPGCFSSRPIACDKRHAFRWSRTVNSCIVQYRCTPLGQPLWLYSNVEIWKALPRRFSNDCVDPSSTKNHYTRLDAFSHAKLIGLTLTVSGIWAKGFVKLWTATKDDHGCPSSKGIVLLFVSRLKDPTMGGSHWFCFVLYWFHATRIFELRLAVNPKTCRNLWSAKHSIQFLTYCYGSLDCFVIVGTACALGWINPESVFNSLGKDTCSWVCDIVCQTDG